MEYDEAMEARNHAYIVAARECFNYMPQDEGECNPDDFMPLLSGMPVLVMQFSGAYTFMGEGLLWNVYE